MGGRTGHGHLLALPAAPVAHLHDSVGEGYLAHVHDPFAAAVALDPALVITRDACVGVELDGALTRGMTVADWAGHWGRPANARIAVDGPGLPEVFFDRYLARVAPFARGLGEAM